VARQDLSSQLAAMTDRVADAGERARIAELQSSRRALAAKLAAMPGSGDSYYERVRKARAAYVEADKKAQQIEVQIISLEAQIVALDKYYADMEAQGGRIAVNRADYDQGAGEAKQLVAELRKQLDAIRDDILLASDEAGISEQLAGEEKAVRSELAAAVAAEAQAMRPVVERMGGGDRQKAERMMQLLAQAERVEGQTDKIITRIEGYVDEQLGEAKTIIVEEKGNVAGYQQQLASYDGESVEVGSEVVGGSFGAVSKKFYEIGVRADVGLLDVSWSQKEQAQGAVEKLRLDFANEKNTMEGELRSIRQEGEVGQGGQTPASPVEGAEVDDAQ
jgi:chromosome segregation ATPase